MKQRSRLISAVLAVIMAVSIVLPFNAMPAFADDGTTVTLVNTASSNASSFQLNALVDEYGGAIDALEQGLINHEAAINIYSYRVPATAMESVIKYLEYYRLCFFLDPYNYNYSWDGYYVYEFQPAYINTAEEAAQYYSAIKAECDEVVAKASQLGTDVEKLLYVHNYLVDTVTYDTTYNDNQNNIYGSIYLNSSMCEGYAAAFAYITTRLGLTTYVITSTEIGHAWNLVYLDGYYYHIDCTWDDPTISNPNLISNPLSGYARNSNFLCSDQEIIDCGHYPEGWDGSTALDWEVNGVSVYGIAANSTKYESLALKSEKVLSHYADGAWYYAINGVSYSTAANTRFKINRLVFLSNSSYILYNDREIYSYFRVSSTGAYKVFYSTLQDIDGHIYYSTASGIYRLVPGGAANGGDDILILSNTVDNNIYDYDIDLSAGTFSVVYGKTIDYTSTNAKVMTYNIADYFCAVEGHRFSLISHTAPTDDVDGVDTYCCVACKQVYTESTYCRQTMINFFMAALNSCSTDSNYNATADVNHDGFVNMRDYSIIYSYEYIDELDWVEPEHIHSIVVDSAVPATCVSTGLTEGSHCETCGEVIVAQTVIPMVDHNWDEGEFTPATTSTAGSITYICTVCGLTKTETPTGWIIINGVTYFYGEDGIAYSGFNIIGSTYYYFDENGVMQTGWQNIGGSTYYFDSQGAMQTGWLQIDGSWYYFGSDGVMVTGLQTISGSKYYFDSNGVMQTGLQTVGGSTYYFDSSGVMVTGWQQIGSSWYYFGTDGAMVTGWKQISGSWYYFNSSGVMQTGWLKDGSYWYYLDSNGKMLVSTSKTINGKTYYFDSSGHCTNP